MSNISNSDFNSILDKLERGEIRSAIKQNGEWTSNQPVKQAILDAFKSGNLELDANGFVDKDTLRPQKFTVDRGVRIVPGGSSVRRGTYVARGVIIMPPSYINCGAFIDEGTMVDSNALVGSCAQIGKNVHLSAGVQIGGVLEPIGQKPVIIEDDVFVGAGSIIVEGIVVSEKAVIAPGVVLSSGTPIYDCVNKTLLKKGQPIPKNAVIVPGSRPVSSKHVWAESMNLNLNCAIIIKYRDESSDASLELENLLR